MDFVFDDEAKKYIDAKNKIENFLKSEVCKDEIFEIGNMVDLLKKIDKKTNTLKEKYCPICQSLNIDCIPSLCQISNIDRRLSHGLSYFDLIIKEK